MGCCKSATRLQTELCFADTSPARYRLDRSLDLLLEHWQLVPCVLLIVAAKVLNHCVGICDVIVAAVVLNARHEQLV